MRRRALIVIGISIRRRALIGIRRRALIGIGRRSFIRIGLRALIGIGLRALMGIGLRALMGVGRRARISTVLFRWPVRSTHSVVQEPTGDPQSRADSVIRSERLPSRVRSHCLARSLEHG